MRLQDGASCARAHLFSSTITARVHARSRRQIAPRGRTHRSSRAPSGARLVLDQRLHRAGCLSSVVAIRYVTRGSFRRGCRRGRSDRARRRVAACRVVISARSNASASARARPSVVASPRWNDAQARLTVARLHSSVPGVAISPRRRAAPSACRRDHHGRRGTVADAPRGLRRARGGEDLSRSSRWRAHHARSRRRSPVRISSARAVTSCDGPWYRLPAGEHPRARSTASDAGITLSPLPSIGRSCTRFVQPPRLARAVQPLLFVITLLLDIRPAAGGSSRMLLCCTDCAETCAGAAIRDILQHA